VQSQVAPSNEVKARRTASKRYLRFRFVAALIFASGVGMHVGRITVHRYVEFSDVSLILTFLFPAIVNSLSVFRVIPKDDNPGST